MMDKKDMLIGVEAVIFDLDGTLADSMWMWKQIDIEYLARFGKSLPEDLQREIEGMSFHETAVYIKNRFNIPDSTEKMEADWNQMAWDKYMNEVPLKPGAHQFLDGLKESGVKMGIASSNSRELIHTLFTSLGIEGYFDCIITGNDVNRGKPFPDIYLKAAAELNVNCEHCLVFEDIVPGIQAGKSAGMKVCAVDDLYSVNVKDEKMKLADYYIEDYYGYF